MNLFKAVFEKTELVFAVAIIIPVIFALNLASFKLWVNILLGIVMFISIRPFFNHEFNIHKQIKPIIYSILLSYVLLSGIYVVLAYFFFGTGTDLFNGYLLLAIVPPAIAIVPLCYVSKCDPETTDAAIITAFLLSLIIIPVSLYLLFGQNIDFMMLVQILAILIIIPVILAAITAKSKNKFFTYGQAINNICSGLIILIGISINREVLLNFSNSAIAYVYLINVIVIFFVGFLVYHITKKLAGEKIAINYSLYASQKNVGTSITIALFMFNPLTAIPAIVALVLQFIFFIFLEKVILEIDK